MIIANKRRMDTIPQYVANFFSQIGGFLYQNLFAYIPPGTGVVLISAAIIGIIVGVYVYLKSRKTDSEQKTEVEVKFRNIFDQITLTRKGLGSYLAEKEVQESKNNWVLLNFGVLTVCNAGYMGPGDDGLFDTRAIRDCLDLGFRGFVFDIDMYTGAPKDPNLFVPPGEPCLLYRDNQQAIRSRNCGKIDQYMRALAEAAFSPSLNSGNDPLIVVLNFKTTPDPVQNRAEYITFLKKVSQQIQPLARRYLDRLGETRFSMMENADLLMTQNFQSLQGRILIFTNVNTDVFINPGETIPNESNLRRWINAQVYSLSSDTLPYDTVTQVQPTGRQMSVGLQNGSYFFTTPDDKVKDAQLKTNNVYTLINAPEAFKNFTVTESEDLAKKYGVQMIMYNPYVDQKSTEEYFKWWGAYSWKLKPKDLQYVVVRAQPPKPISVRADANGGNIAPPALRF